MTSRKTFFVALVSSLLFACGGPEGGADAGVDAGSSVDAGHDGMDGAPQPDSGTTPDGGGTPDAGTDGGPPPPPLTAEQVTDLCTRYCASASDCGQLDAVGGADCQSMCEASLGADNDFIANVNCVFAVECADFANCLGDIPTDADCASACDVATGCGYSDLFELPTPAVCTAVCSGGVASGNPDATAVTSCLADTLAGGCNLFGVLGCMPDGLPDCERLCASVDACDAGSNVRADFADSAACVTYCSGLSEAQRGELSVCIDISDCNGAHCNAIPTSPPDPCTDGCANILDACDATQGFAGELCPHLCSALHEVPESHDLSGFVACTESLTMCEPSLGSDLFGGLTDTYSSALVYCLLDPGPSCTSYCTDAIACSLTDATQFECEVQCGQWRFASPASYSTFETCFTAIDRTQSMDAICSDVAGCT